LALDLYVNDLDETLWKILHLSASACAWPKRCEFIYEHGQGGSGKDTWQTLCLSFFGNRAQGGYGTVIPATWFTTKHTPQPDAPSTTLNQMRGMRYLCNNEIPLHTFFNMDAMKPLCEQEGAFILSRGLYQEPEPWRCMGGVGCTGNPEMVLTETQCEDTGTERRINHSRMRASFNKKALKDVKGPINAGEYNGELFWIVRRFYKYIEKMPNSTRLHPRPPRIIAETNELLSQSVVQKIKTFVESETDAVPFAQATHHLELRDFLKNKFDLGDNWKAKLNSAGVTDKRTDSVRVYQYMYSSENGRLRGIKLRELPTASDTVPPST